MPAGFLERILDYRGYAAAYYANRVNPAGWQSTALRTMAMEIEHELAEEELIPHDGG